MRIADPDGAWMPHPEDARLLCPSRPRARPPATPRYRLLDEGTVVDHDGFTVPTPRPPEGLDLNRNFPAGWGTGVRGSGDHPLSEPEIDALVRAIVARPNICGYNTFHTSGGVILRPSSTVADSTLPPGDVWAWTELGAIGTRLTRYPVHSVFEDFTWDRADTMSGAADDWAYEHLGVFSWTTEFWDAVEAATGTKQSTHFWYTGPTDAEALAVLRWVDEHAPDEHVDWYPFDHPQLGPVELGGWRTPGVWTNPPRAGWRPRSRRTPSSPSPRPWPRRASSSAMPPPSRWAVETWRVELGVANTGWLPTDVSTRARKEKLVLPLVVELVGDGVRVVDGPARRTLHQLEGRAAMRFTQWADGTPDRALATWVVEAAAGSTIELVARHPAPARCGRP